MTAEYLAALLLGAGLAVLATAFQGDYSAARRSAWHFVVCRPWFSNRNAFTGSRGDLLNSQGVCDCGKIRRRRAP